MTETADPELPSEEALEAFFDGNAENTVSSLGDSLEQTKPGSPANAYATYSLATKQAEIDGGVDAGDAVGTVDTIDGGYEICYAPGEGEECFEYTQIEGAEGKITNFSINNKPIRDRLTVGNGRWLMVEGLDARAQLLAAFETTSSNNLAVVASPKTGRRNAISGIEASYRSPEGRQSNLTDMTGPLDLGADSLANYAFYLPNGALGGKLIISMYDESFTHEGSVSLKTS